MCDKSTYSNRSVSVTAAELASSVDAVVSVVTQLAVIAATTQFDGTLEELQELRDWVDVAYVLLVELAQRAADRVDVELSELDAVPPTDRPPS